MNKYKYYYRYSI